MSVARTPVQASRCCAACQQVKELYEFYHTTTPYCRPCFKLYQAERRRALAANLPIQEWRPYVLMEASRPDRLDSGWTLGAEFDWLFQAAYQREGFGGLQRRIEAAQRRVATRNRAAIYREGWIV